jgi:hypothetical protein
MKRLTTVLAALPIALITLLARCDCASVAAKPEGAECATAQECDGALVCDLASGTCEDGTECTVHADCGTGAYCDADGACADSESGGPCDVDTNCLSPEECRDGTCFAQGSEGDGCTTTQECTLPLTGDPATDTCTTDVGCTNNADCGAASYCGPDGLCEDSLTCAVGDDDCVPMGAACAREMQCAGRQCVTDPQHATAYCSRHCDAASPCPSPWVCEPTREVCQHAQLPEVAEGEACVPEVMMVCAPGSECHEARCRRSCVSQAQCADETRCDFERHLCMPAEVSLGHAVVLEPAAKSGCAVAPLSQFAMVLCVLFLRPKKSRRLETLEPH